MKTLTPSPELARQIKDGALLLDLNLLPYLTKGDKAVINGQTVTFVERFTDAARPTRHGCEVVYQNGTRNFLWLS